MATKCELSRRQFMGRGLTLVAIPVTLSGHARSASAADQVDLADPTAQALSYVHDAATSDKRADSSQTCANCQLYTGLAGDEWGPCALFPSKTVGANGWCSAWALKSG